MAPRPTDPKILIIKGSSFLADGMLVVLLLALANFLLHLYFNNRYGYFRMNLITWPAETTWPGATWTILH